ncbi:protein kinase domain-containing protein [Shimazuella kribbensis]|uniref:protein kinase domain-containing protein n=1 Tax=Shimazuella kribbensis TaxID=139808 RepID=UPI00041B6615|nr:protein kinase [Shimazuella kribbensis]
MLGNIIAGRYEILEHIAGGGMATVYLGRDNVLNRIVAVKVMDPQLGQDDEFVKRFILEAQATGRLSHPNIVNVYDAGEENGIYYMVMEFVESITLKDYIIEKGFLTAEEAIDICMQICDGLAHAHKQGIIHRDIKPHNILCTPDGRYKLTDFGIARLVDAATHLTKTGTVMGSVHYFSPEQASGHNISYPSDLYSLGVVLFEMLTGSVPFDAKEHILVAMMHLHDEVPDPRLVQEDLPESLKLVLDRVLAKKPEERYQNADEFRLALQQALAYGSENKQMQTESAFHNRYHSQPATDERSWEQETKVEPPSQSSMKYMLIGLAVLVIVALSYFFWPTGEPNALTNEKVPTKEQTSNTSQNQSSYIVITGIFKNRENAEKLVEKLKDHQLYATVKPKQLNEKKRYQVYLGPYSSKEQANDTLVELKQYNLKDVKDPYIKKSDDEA